MHPIVKVFNWFNGLALSRPNWFFNSFNLCKTAHVEKKKSQTKK